ncbi:MAG: glycosyltransferase family 2 protein [Candidatus Cryptobacteroides sp.]
MRPIVSVIVPAYNSESSIQKCIESIQKQTVEDIEIVIVDDGSIDDTGNLCHTIIEADKRVSYVHQSNSGPYNARMTGINRANGRYLTFVDSDDTIKADTLEVMLALMNEGIDVVVLESAYDAELTVEEYAKCLLSFKFLSVWGKLFRRELFDEVINDVPSWMKVGEDFLMNLKTLNRIKGNVIIRKLNKYNYKANSPHSIQRIQRLDYDYEKTMVLLVDGLISNLQFYQDLRHSLFKWKMKYLSGMIANRYNVLYDDDWIQNLVSESNKEMLSFKDKITIAAVNGSSIMRGILILSRSIKETIRALITFIKSNGLVL